MAAMKDPWSLLKLMREKAASLGAVFVKGNVAALHMDRNKVASVICSEPELEISCGSFGAQICRVLLNVVLNHYTM